MQVNINAPVTIAMLPSSPLHIHPTAEKGAYATPGEGGGIAVPWPSAGSFCLGKGQLPMTPTALQGQQHDCVEGSRLVRQAWP